MCIVTIMETAHCHPVRENAYCHPVRENVCVFVKLV